MAKGAAKTMEDKEIMDKANSNLVATLYKHVNDWYNQHPGATFITPRDFKNAYPQWDKFSNESFRRNFYVVKNKILKGEFNLCSIVKFTN